MANKKPDQLALIGLADWKQQPRRFSRICRESSLSGKPLRARKLIVKSARNC